MRGSCSSCGIGCAWGGGSGGCCGVVVLAVGLDKEKAYALVWPGSSSASLVRAGASGTESSDCTVLSLAVFSAALAAQSLPCPPSE
jgi:hypothetical protein